MQNPIKQSVQSQQSIVVVDESTFTYLPKVSKAIGLSTLTMDQVSSKKLKNHQRFGLFLRDLDPVAFNRKVDPLPGSCFNCRSRKHRLIDCPEPLIGIFCCNCGRRYVRIDECPRCSRVFWKLDASARHWLISYIPEGDPEEDTDYSEKDWSKYTDDMDGNTNKDSDSSNQKRRKSEPKQVEELSEYASASTLVSRTTDKDKGDNDEWWAGGKSKDKNVEERLTQKQKTENGSLKSQSNSENDSPSEKNLCQLDNLKDNSDFDNQVNLLGDSSSAKSHPLECHTTTHIHVEDQDNVTDCSEEDWSKYENDMGESISGESDSGKLKKRVDSLKTEELTRCESESVSRTTEECKSDTDNWWAGGPNKEETLDDKLNLELEENENNHENTSVIEEDRKDKENVQMTLAKTESDCEIQFNSHDDSSNATPSEEDEEDYDNVIVDEQLEDSSVVGSTVREFLDLLKAAKYLPLQQQNRIVLRFASECKKKF